MPDQQLDVFDGEEEGERLWEALSSFKKVVRDLVEMTGLSTNVLADTYGFGKGKVATWQTPKREAPNIPPLRFVEVLIKEAQERANLQDGPAAVFLAQYGELLKLYCARAKPHNVHRQMLADYQNTLLIRELNNATNAALEQIAALTDELETLRDDRDEERQQRIALQQQIDSLGSQNQNRAVEKRAALAMRDEVRAALTPYESDPLPVPVREQQRAEQGGSHENHGGLVPPLPPPPGRGTKRRGLVLALIPAGVLVVCLAVYIGTQLRGDHSGPKDTAGTSPGPAVTADGSAAPSRGTTSAGTSATPPAAGGGPAHGGNSSSGGSSGNDASGGSGSGGDASGGNTTGGNASGGGNTTGGKTTGGSGDPGGSGGSNGPSSSGGSGGSEGSGGGQAPAPSGKHYLKNAATNRCLAESASPYGGTMVRNMVCGEPAHNGATAYYTWTYKPTSGGEFKLIGQGSGQCLKSRGVAGIGMESCNDSESQTWRIAGTSPNGHTLENVADRRCLRMAATIGFQMVDCDAADAAQLWRDS
ncbi:hypothetical protein ABT218_07210 [Streptomyces sp. NPDC001455]|uniref:RICIN domain-containing protein n=1 Tax=Streptomyces sp. NPDC001455 TaxID=3154518 RepID=UPI003327A6C7